MSIQQQSASTTSATSAAAAAANQPVIQRIIPAQGPVRGGVEITLLGCNFRPGLSVKFGANVSLATHCWSDSTIVTYLPPASSAGPVLVTFTEDGTNREYLLNSSSNQIFTYTDDTDKQLIELALQIVGLKMNGKLEDAKNIAKRIIGNNNTNGGGSNGETIDSNSASGGASTSMDTSISQDSNNSNYELWLEQASAKIEQLSKSGFNYEQILIKFLSMLQLPNSPISQPNWAICNNEGQTLLHLACLKNYYKLSLFLLHRGSKVDFHDVNNLSPLHYSLINEILLILMY
ncbi:unnamed protein product [[Candida] boidinii]|nr:unnamed protein product [[Candida] boidinii]